MTDYRETTAGQATQPEKSVRQRMNRISKKSSSHQDMRETVTGNIFKDENCQPFWNSLFGNPGPNEPNKLLLLLDDV